MIDCKRSQVDELRRDIQVVNLARENQIEVTFVHDTCLVEPGKVLTKENKPYAMFSPVSNLCDITFWHNQHS
jgi:deoxyribodipyrimidine photolyase